MPDWSRRQTLSSLAGGLAVALAGCRGEASDESVSGDVQRRGDEEQRVEEYELERVRNTDGATLFSRSQELRSDRPGGYDHLTSREDLEEYTFGDVPEARALREFSAATDFESESVYLYARQVEACYNLRLQRVEVDDGSPSAHFCRDLRPVDEECEADVHHTAGYAIRLPFPGDRYSGKGAGMSSSCSRPPRPERFDANVTLSNESDGR